jgi:hypothetical protein
MAAPQLLLDLLHSLRLDGIPGQALPGERISPRVVPDLAPLPDNLPNPTLEALTTAEPIAQVISDLKPIVDYLAKTLGIDLRAIAKAVEFNKPAEARPDLIDMSSSSIRDLPHLVPKGLSAGTALEVSQFVAGLIARAAGKLDFKPGSVASEVTASIQRPAVLLSLPTVTLQFRVLDESGKPLASGQDYFSSLHPFAPDFVFLPVVVDPGGSPVQLVRRSFCCDVTLNYTPVVGPPGELKRTLGPVSVDIPTLQVPLIAVLTEHAVTDSRFPGRVLLGVPGNSPIGDAATALQWLESLRAALSNVIAVLNLLKIGVPGPVTAALSAITTVGALSVGRFKKDDLIGFFELFDDWQGIFSAVFVFGATGKEVSPGRPAPLEVFTVSPGVLGVASVPDLSVHPLAPAVGSATQVFPVPPAAPAGGSFNDMLTSIDMAM